MLYNVKMVWQLMGSVEIEANTPEEAKEIALGPDTPLPNGEYLADSALVDEIEDADGNLVWMEE
jgi:hypothetical protein